MSKPQLALPAPYGYNDGYHISITSQEGFDESGAIQAVMSFGCPRKVADKAISCLRYSNRYDCVMSPQAWQDGRHRGLREKLQAVGCDVELRSGPVYGDDPGREARRERQAEQRAYHLSQGGARAVRQAQNLPRRLEIEDYNRIERILEEARYLRYAK